MRCILREVREHYNRRHMNQQINQSELAKRVSTSQATIARIESGQVEPGAFLLTKIAKVFRIRVEALIDIDYAEVRRLRRPAKKRGRPPKQKRSDFEAHQKLEEMAAEGRRSLEGFGIPS